MSIQINGTSGISGVDGTAGTPALQGTDSNTGISFGADTVNINTGGTTRATVDSSGRVLVGTSTAAGNFFNGSSSTQMQIGGSASLSLTQGANDAFGSYCIFAKSRSSGNTIVQSGDQIGLISFQGNDGSEHVEAATIQAVVDGTPGANDMPGRLVFSTTADGASSPTERMRIDSSGVVKFTTQTVQIGGGTNQNIFRSGADGSGLHFTTNGILPTNETGNISDNTETWGNSAYRWSVIYAASGTINTSDANEKQDIQDLSAAELAVAKELKNLFKTFKWKNAVAEKGDNARIHVGVIAQDVQQLFADHGLDVTKYGLWCSDTWYEVDGIGVDSNGIPYKADSEGATARTRLGIRYDELLAFVLAAL
jgi:hypothetical protein